MKQIKLKEAKGLSAYEKMDLFNKGQRRENIKACSIQKLCDYYRICIENNFKSAERQICAELLLRDAGVYVKPDALSIDSTYFTVYGAKFVQKKCQNPDVIIEAAAQHPFTGLTSSDTLTVYLIFAIMLQESTLVEAIKQQMKLYNTYYSAMPEVLVDILGNPSFAEALADIMLAV